jgi:tetraacyldisaccharide 4'-kinase
MRPRAPAFWESDGPIARALAPLGAGYGALGRLRGIGRAPERIPSRVVVVGNVVAGGAGKTPVALALAERLTRAGARVHLLGRGYGGRLPGPHRVDPSRDGFADVGDEALLLAGAAPTWIARNRRAGLRAAGGADIVIVDDGHQDPTFARDLGILVVDGVTGFGNGRLVPAGPLRERPERAAARADAIVVLGEDRRGIGAWAHAFARPIARARLVPTIDLAAFAERPVVAFAGIGRPAKFFAMLEAAGLELAARRAFPDHHAYSDAEIAALTSEAGRRGARLVTTEKDRVRLPAAASAGVIAVPVALVWDEPAALDALLARVLPP